MPFVPPSFLAGANAIFFWFPLVLIRLYTSAAFKKGKSPARNKADCPEVRISAKTVFKVSFKSTPGSGTHRPPVSSPTLATRWSPPTITKLSTPAPFTAFITVVSIPITKSPLCWSVKTEANRDFPSIRGFIGITAVRPVVSFIENCL